VTCGVSNYGDVIGSVGEERRVLKKMFGHENDDVTAGRREANNEKP
jgi:hypothetical protein